MKASERRLSIARDFCFESLQPVEFAGMLEFLGISCKALDDESRVKAYNVQSDRVLQATIVPRLGALFRPSSND